MDIYDPMMEKKQLYFYVYKTTNLINGKIYVGAHSTYLIEDGYMGSGKGIKAAIKKYGRSNFKRELLELCLNRIILLKREIHWILELNALGENGYNRTLNAGANPNREGYVFTEEHKRNISKALKGNIISEETRAKLRISSTGYRHTLDAKQNFAAAHKGKSKPKYSEARKRAHSKSLKGHKVSEETKRKIGLANSKKKRTAAENATRYICPHCGKEGGKDE